MREGSLKHPVGWEAEAGVSTVATSAWLLAGLRAGNLTNFSGLWFLRL